jgi:hypothetical protein
MKIFIKKLLLFTLPVLFLALSFEFLLRKIPNDYLFKRKFLDEKSDSVKVLFLGSSHAYFDINPAHFSSYSFNASHVSQSLDYDFEILKKYKNNWHSLKCIALPISYFSLFGNIETGLESWRVKNYILYYGMHTSTKSIDHSEILGNKIDVVIRRLISYYIDGNSNITCSDLGWRLNHAPKEKRDLEITGKKAAIRHSLLNADLFEENKAVLKSIIEFARERHINVLFYTPPAYHTYVENLDPARLNSIIKTLTDIDQANNNVLYKNFLTDSSFAREDFFDADHLNETGAKKFTIKIDSLINQNNMLK